MKKYEDLLKWDEKLKDDGFERPKDSAPGWKAPYTKEQYQFAKKQALLNLTNKDREEYKFSNKLLKKDKPFE